MYILLCKSTSYCIIVEALQVNEQSRRLEITVLELDMMDRRRDNDRTKGGGQ